MGYSKVGALIKVITILNSQHLDQPDIKPTVRYVQDILLCMSVEVEVVRPLRGEGVVHEGYNSQVSLR